MSIAFHGTPIVPVTRNGRAARSICDSTTRPSEDKANPVAELIQLPALLEPAPCRRSRYVRTQRNDGTAQLETLGYR
jgi:hypothetical protein